MAIKQLSEQTRGIRSRDIAQTLGPGRGWEKRNKEGDTGEGPWLQETKQNTLNCKSRFMRQQTEGVIPLKPQRDWKNTGLCPSSTVRLSLPPSTASPSLSFFLNFLSLITFLIFIILLLLILILSLSPSYPISLSSSFSIPLIPLLSLIFPTPWHSTTFSLTLSLGGALVWRGLTNWIWISAPPLF